MLDVVLSSLLSPWSTSTVVAASLIALLPLILIANQAARRPQGRCAAGLRRFGSFISPRRMLNRTVLHVGMTFVTALAALAIVIPVMNGLATRPASAADDLVRLYRRSVGPYDVTVLTDQSPIRAGIVSFSVMIKRPDGKIVRDARLALTATPADARPAKPVNPSAELGTGPVSHLVSLDLSEPGRWRISMQITGSEGGGTLGFEVDVAPPPLYEQSAVQATVGGAAVAPIAWWGWRRFSRQTTQGGDRR